MDYYIGIDIGSTSAKTIVINNEEEIVERNVRPTGYSSVETAGIIKEDLESKGISFDSSYTIATGYGRVSVPYANETLTEITCHGKGALKLFGEQDMVTIDIGGQDTKIIRISSGNVEDFMMNDKCSAGTGRFLEVMANSLSVTPEELCDMAQSASEKDCQVSISSLCTVFAESEVISLIGRGVPREEIAFAVVDSIVTKVATQAERIVSSGDIVCLTGGLCDSNYICEALGKALKTNIITAPDARYAGAIGAAVTAKKKAK